MAAMKLSTAASSPGRDSDHQNRTGRLPAFLNNHNSELIVSQSIFLGAGVGTLAGLDE
jgi:hypothetical protein